MKKTDLGEGSKANHLSYLGDAKIGKGVNIGAGTITCNYDGVRKAETVIGNEVFIGSDTQLIAPVTVGSGSVIAAGTTVTVNVPDDSLVIFIFAVVGEELGFLGVLAALVLFLFLFLRIVRVATRANDSFGSLTAFGMAASWFVHVVVNVGMTINLMPITGIPLPFFSYGPSFLLSSWIALGMLVRISSEGRGKAGEIPFELRA